MRVAGWIVVLAGCSSKDEVRFEHQSTLEGPLVGLALDAATSKAQAGMVGNTCAVETANGLIGEDHDVITEEDDRVYDTYAGHTLVGGGSSLLVLAEGPELDVDSASTQSGVSFAFLTDGEVVGLSHDGGCWAFIGEESVELTVDCANSVADVQRESSTLVVADGSSIALVNSEGVTTISEEVDLIAWDAAAEVLYVAQAGESWVKGLNAVGEELWTSTVDGMVKSLDDLPGQNAAIVMVELDDGSGELLTLDAVDGEVTSSEPTPSAGESVLAGNNGETVAVVLPDQVHFFAVSR